MTRHSSNALLALVNRLPPRLPSAMAQCLGDACRLPCVQMSRHHRTLFFSGAEMRELRDGRHRSPSSCCDPAERWMNALPAPAPKRFRVLGPVPWLSPHENALRICPTPRPAPFSPNVRHVGHRWRPSCCVCWPVWQRSHRPYVSPTWPRPWVRTPKRV